MKWSMSWLVAPKHWTMTHNDLALSRFACRVHSIQSLKKCPRWNWAYKNKSHSLMESNRIKIFFVKMRHRWNRRSMISRMFRMMAHRSGRSPLSERKWVRIPRTWRDRLLNVWLVVDAQSERQTPIYSPPFFSSPTGYKMRARLCLHGDGNARRTHMSLFFVLMRGPNDAILKFPFSYKVTFCLYDQTAQQRHIVDSFRPDIKSNSFQRPQSETNIASGVPKFAPLSTIDRADSPYVRDDTMFIRIMVDSGNMPSWILPYALSLNPGLPMHVQQEKINEELEKRRRGNISPQWISGN